MLRTVICGLIFTVCSVAAVAIGEHGLLLLVPAAIACSYDSFTSGYERGAKSRDSEVSQLEIDRDGARAGADRVYAENRDLKKKNEELQASLKEKFKMEYDLSEARDKLDKIASIIDGRLVLANGMALTSGTAPVGWRRHP